MYLNKENQGLQYPLFNQFIAIKRIGKGHYGQVLLVQNKINQQYALKIVDKPYRQRNKDNIIIFKAQMQFLKQIQYLRFQRQVKFYGHLQDQQKIGLLFEYFQFGDLLNYQAKLHGKVFSIKSATKILSQILKALQQLHLVGMSHGNLKSQNIYIQKKNNQQLFKLKDFGYPPQIKLEEYFIDHYGYAQQFTKTCDWIPAPECFQIVNKYQESFDQSETKKYFFNQHSPSSQDIWSFGILFYFMLNKQFPFQKQIKKYPWNYYQSKQQKKRFKFKTPKQGYSNMIKCYLMQSKQFSYEYFVSNSRCKLMENCTPQIESFFKKVFQFDPQKRIKLNQIKEHSLFQMYFTNNQHKQSCQFENKSFVKLENQLANLKVQNNNLKIQNEQLNQKGKQVQKLSKQIKDLLN